MKISFIFTTIAGAMFLAQVALALPPDHGGLPTGDLPRDPGGDIDCASFVTGTVTAVPTSIKVGESVTLTWIVSIPDRCPERGITVGGQPVSKQGSMTIQPSRTQSYILKQDVMTLAQVRIEVGYPPRVVIDSSTHDPILVLLGALVDSTNHEQTVELCDVDLDLTGYSIIVIEANRSLIASPACARGPRSYGPRIFVRDKRGSKPLFEIRDDNVRFSGFRIEGPTSGTGSDDENLEIGIKIFPGPGTSLIHNVEISNMEVSHWSGAAIAVRDNAELEERGRLTNENVSAVRIKNNFLHHNRHFSGYGYGVVVGNGAYALIEQNVFDENRHAIAGDSSDGKKDFSGYTARANLILKGGGRHCKVINNFPDVCWWTHQIDMHGDKSTLLGGDFCCGNAGETLIIEHNTILYTNGNAIKIRGNPTDKVVVDGNVFRHPSRSDAIAQTFDLGDSTTHPIDVRPNNVFGSDPLTVFGSCDFFGDGVLDQFMPTGVTWWAMSPITHQWRYLNTMPERLSQVQLEKFDNDGKCDVVLQPTNHNMLPRTYSKNGMGPWVPMHALVP